MEKLNQDIIDLVASYSLIVSKSSKRLYEIWKKNNTIYYDAVVPVGLKNISMKKYYSKKCISTSHFITLRSGVKYHAPKYLIMDMALITIENRLELINILYSTTEYLLIDQFNIRDVTDLARLVMILPLKKMTILRYTEDYGEIQKFPHKIKNSEGKELSLKSIFGITFYVEITYLLDE